LIGAYQYGSDEDGDPDHEGSVLGTTVALNDEGAWIFQEVNRPREYAIMQNWNTRPVGRRFTVAHEIGHLFYGEHSDMGLMRQSILRTSPLLSNITINKIRGGLFVDENGITRRITHP
jgi:hypothetical protein